MCAEEAYVLDAGAQDVLGALGLVQVEDVLVEPGRDEKKVSHGGSTRDVVRAACVRVVWHPRR